ncbi:hypothetical protein PUG46_00395 [Erwiniaceae bacterium L1_55_4]|nr:hypothetical protein [Erwiniaceae bacterium L1_55_4]
MKKVMLAGLLATVSFAALADDIPADYIPSNLPEIPSSAYVTAPQSEQEGAVGTDDLYGEGFDAYIFSKFPDIKIQKFVPDSAMDGDQESIDIYKTGFYRALYFAKLVKLSDDRLLYDFLMKCAKLNRSATFADRESADTNQFNIQYFFELKRRDSGELVGESIFIHRAGNKFSAMRTPFAYFALSDKKYMKTYGLECAK